jgi:hypothetical protein
MNRTVPAIQQFVAMPPISAQYPKFDLASFAVVSRPARLPVTF